jgi:two-component system, LytTR family, response regulator
MSPRAISVVVAEDEPPARRHLVKLLRRYDDVRVVAECANGEEALEAVHALSPDVLLLDIQMPGLNGFEVLSRLSEEELPAVVFVTAFDQFALRAFEVHALDYILKPVDDERFERAMKWVRGHIDGPALRQLQTSIAALAQTAPTHRTSASRPPGWSTRLAVKVDGRLVFLPSSAITHVTAEGCYARVHTRARTYLIREALSSLEARLPSGRFARIHRSTIVNLAGVQSIEPLTHGESRLHMANGLVFKVSRSYRAAIKTLY